MQERIGNWFWTSTLLLAACGSVEDASSLAKSRAALAPTTSSTSSASFSPPAGERACWDDADCAAGEECESEHGRYYCAPQHRDKDYYGADAGAPQECRQHGEDCSRSATPDAGAYTECDGEGHPGDETYDDEHEGHDDDEERSGSNHGPH